MINHNQQLCTDSKAGICFASKTFLGLGTALHCVAMLAAARPLVRASESSPHAGAWFCLLRLSLAVACFFSFFKRHAIGQRRAHVPPL